MLIFIHYLKIKIVVLIHFFGKKFNKYIQSVARLVSDENEKNIIWLLQFFFATLVCSIFVGPMYILPGFFVFLIIFSNSWSSLKNLISKEVPFKFFL